MVFNFFGLKKKPVIEDVVPKVPTEVAKPVSMTFDEALAVQEKADAVAAENEAKAKAEAEEKAVAIEKAEQDAAELAAAQKAAITELKESTSSLEMLVQFDASQKEDSPPAEPAAAPQANHATEVLGQMDTITATREDVIAAYKIFLGRLPESMEVVAPRVGVSPAALLVDFLASKEFLDQAPKSQLVLAVAKKILDERKQAAATEGQHPLNNDSQRLKLHSFLQSATSRCRAFF